MDTFSLIMIGVASGGVLGLLMGKIYEKVMEWTLQKRFRKIAEGKEKNMLYSQSKTPLTPVDVQTFNCPDKEGNIVKVNFKDLIK